MLKKIMQDTTIFSAKKIIKKSMSNNLDIKIIQDEVIRQFDKNKSYLLYIHVPFCHTFCPFCSFHKYKYDEDKAINYFKSLRIEMKKVADEGYSFDSLYVGGGTTLINEGELIKTLELAQELFDIKEISCETDPNHISADSLKNFKGIIDRLSVGVQSFDDGILKKVARYEKFGSAEVLQEKIASMVGILPSTNLDFIFNFPTQTADMIRKDMKIAKELGVEQITTYPLMSSELTNSTMSKAFDTQRNSQEYAFYKLIQEELKDYQPNNAWSFGKEKSDLSDEYLATHNEYIGIGSGAFTFLNDTLYVNAYDLSEYDSLIAKRPHAIIAQSTFGTKEKIQFQFLTWLFNGGIDIEKFNTTFNTSILSVLKQELFMLKSTSAIKIENGQILPTEFGKYVALTLMKEFYSGMDKVRAMFKKRVYQPA